MSNDMNKGLTLVEEYDLKIEEFDEQKNAFGEHKFRSRCSRFVS